MKSRFVRFAAPSYGSDNKADADTTMIAPRGDGAASGSGNTAAPASTSEIRRLSISSANGMVSVFTVPTDTPSLASALAQSVRHHSRMVDGELPPPMPEQQQENIMASTNYLDNFSSTKKAWGSYVAQSGSMLSSERRPSLDDTVITSSTRGGRVIDRSSFQTQQFEQVESFGTNNGSNRDFIEASENDNYTSFPRRSAQVTGYNRSFNSSVPVGEVSGSSSSGRRSNFITPPPWASHFLSASMRHSSQLPISSERNNMESRLDASRRILTSRKILRRNDSFLRFIVVVLCFGLSLMFAIFYGEGKFGLALANMAYELKVTHMYGTANLTDPNVQEIVSGELVYPEWWDNQIGIPNMRAKDIQFSATLENHTADVSKPRPPGRVDTPFFWFTPRSRGNVIRAIMANCLHLVEASGFGKDSTQPFLLVQEREGRKFVNVDLTTPEGLSRAKELKLASSGIPDVIISEDIHSILNIFDSDNRVIMFAVFRHPFDRAMSKYYADIASDPAVAGIPLQQYIRSGENRLENNHMTRYLSGRYHGDLRVEHLDIAREFLRRKFVVGLARDMPTTAEMFLRVFGWRNATDTRGSEALDQCSDNIFHELAYKANPALEEGSEGWKMVMAKNWFDLKLYEYAEHLFQLQVDHLKLKSSMKTRI